MTKDCNFQEYLLEGLRRSCSPRLTLAYGVASALPSKEMNNRNYDYW